MWKKILPPETPCIVIDEAIAKENCRKMQQEITARRCRLRPHTKTHKMSYFTRMQMEAGCNGICCAKVSEAEVMAAGGARDIFIAYPLVGAFRLRRALALVKKLDRLILAVDSLEGAKALDEAAREASVIFEVRLEVDTGAKRTGAAQAQCVELAKAVRALPGLRLTGIYTFKSLVLSGQPTTDPQAAGEEEGSLMAQVAQALGDQGILLEEISAGSTPTAKSVAGTGLVDEVRPGTYIFGDAMLMKEGVCTLEEVAVRLYATVVSTPSPDLAILDGGSKTFPMDIVPLIAPYFYPGYAAVVREDGTIDENLQLLRLSEEHGMLTAKNGKTGLKVGQCLELIPIHICPAVNLQNTVFVYQNGNLERMTVEARGMLV